LIHVQSHFFLHISHTSKAQKAIEPKIGFQAIRAIVPLARMFGYSTAIRSATQGRGTFNMQFSHFDRI
jgi:elongation factor G